MCIIFLYYHGWANCKSNTVNKIPRHRVLNIGNHIFKMYFVLFKVGMTRGLKSQTSPRHNSINNYLGTVKISVHVHTQAGPHLMKEGMQSIFFRNGILVLSFYIH